MIAPEAPLELVFDALALERCFLAGEILQASRPAPLEYALLGLSTSERPLHVVATPLLPGQRVSEASVVQPAAGVVRLGSEIDALSARLQRRLLPIAFVHAHPGSCDASRVDLDFMTGPFVDQCSTAVSFEAVRAVGSGEPPCACPGLQRLWCSRVGLR